jgi:hypothetical protein
MIIRLTQNLEKKIGVHAKTLIPPHSNPFLDWTGNVFKVAKQDYIILTNTPSLYSFIISGRGVSNEGILVQHALSNLKEIMRHDNMDFIYQRLIAANAKLIQYSKTGNRSLQGSQTDFVIRAKVWLEEKNFPLFEISQMLNDIPMSSLSFRSPRDAFRSQHIQEAPSLTISD